MIFKSAQLLAMEKEITKNMSIELLPDFIRENYEVHEWKHACAILKEDFVNEWNDIVSVL